MTSKNFSHFKILVADEIAEDGLAILRRVGDVTVQKGMNEETLMKKLPGFHALVVRSATQVTQKSLQDADQLAIIGRAGIGVDNIDVEAATAKGVVVMNTPEAGAISTGEHALSLLFALARHIPSADASIRAGFWEKSKFTGVDIHKKQLGILGLGRIGRIVGERAQALGMIVSAYDPFVLPAAFPAGIQRLDLEELLASSDFITVHMPLMDETRNFLNESRLRKMKKGSRLICAARGGLIDENALCQLLENGHIAGAALDVFQEEPLPKDSPLRKTPHLILTPHLGASTVEAKFQVSIEMCQQIALCLEKGIVLNGVNVPRIAPSEAAQIGPYLGLVHNMASLLSQVFSGPIDSLRLTVQGPALSSALRALSVAMTVGALKPRITGALTPVNAEKVAKEKNIPIFSEIGTLKKDFLNLIRVEAVINHNRHMATGTVLGHKHGRLIELDHYILDAIPEPPLLVTFHNDQPGVMGQICTRLGEANINIGRMQISPCTEADEKTALAVLNLDQKISEELLETLQKIPSLKRAVLVR
jgi:D-3-phosphoglycerate dehydrogenase